jgi:signal transduction histidine kinase
MKSRNITIVDANNEISYRREFDSGEATAVVDAYTLELIAANQSLANLAGKPLEQLVGKPLDFICRSNKEQSTDWGRDRTAIIERRTGQKIAVTVIMLYMERLPRPTVVLRILPKVDASSSGSSTLENKHASLSRAHRELQSAYNRLELLNDTLNYKNQELREVYRRLAFVSKMAAIGELTAGATHGINNPLAALVSANRGIAAQLETFPESAEKTDIQSLLSVADKAVRRIEGIVADLRHLARSGSRRGEVNWVSLSEEVKIVLELVSHRMKNVELEVSIPKDIEIRVCPDEFDQVIMNMVDNAVAAMEGQGLLRISAAQINQEVVLDIEDNGSGIPQEIVDRVFDPFFSTKPPSQGSGIGLAISKDIIEGYAGKIEINTDTDRGTIVSIRLPGEWKSEETS